jgi:hypothetical protein
MPEGNSNTHMPFKFDDKGQIVLQDVNGAKLPVFIGADGKESPFDADATVDNVRRLKGEAQSHREAKEAAEAALKPFKDAGITDAAAAAQALTTVKNLKDGELVTAGKVQEIKDAAARSAQEAVAAATRAAEEQRKTLEDQNAKLTTQLHGHVIGNNFANSKFIKEKLLDAIQGPVAQKIFGDAFKVDDKGNLVATLDGQPIFSATRHGEHADFEEAISVIVQKHPLAASFMKGSGGSGGGANGGPGGGGAGGGKKQITRSAFEKLNPADQMAAARDSTIVDG